MQHSQSAGSKCTECCEQSLHCSLVAGWRLLCPHPTRCLLHTERFNKGRKLNSIVFSIGGYLFSSQQTKRGGRGSAPCSPLSAHRGEHPAAHGCRKCETEGTGPAWFSPARCRMRAVCLQQPQHLSHRQTAGSAFHCAQATASVHLRTQTAQHRQPCAQSRVWCDPVLPQHLALPPWGHCMHPSSCTKSPERALTFCLPSAERGPQCSISTEQLSACPGNKQGKQSKLQ